jgi:hypothetical protein
MAKKPEISKTQAVRDYLGAHPGAFPLEIVAALRKHGITITSSHVANIKTKINKTGTARKAATKQTAEAPAPAAVEKPTKNGDAITLEQVKKVAHTVKSIGGFQRVTEVLDVIKALGGVKKFRELAEAISVTNTDDIPF